MRSMYHQRFVVPVSVHFRSSDAGAMTDKYRVFGPHDLCFAPLGRSIRDNVPELNQAQVGVGGEKIIGLRPSS